MLIYFFSLPTHIIFLYISFVHMIFDIKLGKCPYYGGLIMNAIAFSYGKWSFKHNSIKLFIPLPNF